MPESYGRSGGVELTDEVIERLAREAEAGYDVSQLRRRPPRRIRKLVDAGWSTCPRCDRHWKVTVWDDCLMPACGCYGKDASPDNPSRLCGTCGLLHALSCEGMPGPIT